MLDALDAALECFGPGNVYTNLIYGLQSLSGELDASSFAPERENAIALEATRSLLARGIIPAFTVYHFGGHNPIGAIDLSSDYLCAFFMEWGRLVRGSRLVPPWRDAVLFGCLSLSNTLFNEGFLLAKLASHDPGPLAAGRQQPTDSFHAEARS
jgi:hypothetical protein